MTSFFMQASLLIGLVNIVLTVVLFGLYRRIHQQTRADFTRALMVFAGAFMVQNILVVYSYLQTMPLIPDPLSPYLFGIGATEAAGLAAIVWTALQ